MTICVAVKVHDCIVFAADSASSLIESTLPGARPLIANVYAHGNKVFNLRKGLPIAAMTCGMGNIGPVSISTLAKDLRVRFCSDDPDWALDAKNYSIEEVTDKARKFFFEHYSVLADKPTGPHEFQFWIGGNGSEQTHGEIWRIRIVNGENPEAECLAGKTQFDILYDGQPEAINRIVNGYSQHLPKALLEIGLKEEKLDSVLAHIETHTLAPLIAPAMPVQDAIALADFLVDTTKRYVRFLPGADTVGGDTDICVVTKHEGFKWIRRKHYFDTRLNPVEAENVS